MAAGHLRLPGGAGPRVAAAGAGRRAGGGDRRDDVGRLRHPSVGAVVQRHDAGPGGAAPAAAGAAACRPTGPAARRRRWRRQPTPRPGCAAPGPACPTARDAVRLFYLQGLSHSEVAGELGVSVGAVKSRLHQARAALAPRLAQVIDIPGHARVTGVPKEKAMATTSAVDWIDAEVTEVAWAEGEDFPSHKYVMMLAERGGERRLPIWIGPAEAVALRWRWNRPRYRARSATSWRPAWWMRRFGRIAEVADHHADRSGVLRGVIVQGPGGPRESTPGQRRGEPRPGTGRAHPDRR